MMPCSFTPFTKNIVTGILLLRMLFKKTSWTLCDFSLAMCFVLCSWGRASPPDPRPGGAGAALARTINIGWPPRNLSLSQISQKSSAIREIEGRFVPWKLAIRRRRGPHQDRRAAGIVGASEVDVGIPDQPD